MKRKKEIDYSMMPECDVLVNHINKRYSRGLNTNMYVIGLSGTGKSSTSQRIGEKLIESREEGVQMQITDSFLGLLKAIRSSKEGDIIIIEEVSVLFPSKRAMAEENVNIGKVLDTCRKRQLCIISNAPLWKSIDSHMRAMGHLLIETLKINKKHSIVISKFHRLQTNPLTAKTYRHTMQRKGRDVSRLYTKMPNQDRWDEYEDDKDKFMDELYKVIEFKQNKKKAKLDKEMNIVQPEVDELSIQELRVHKLFTIEGLTQAETARRMGVTDSWVKQLRDKIKEKTKIPLEKRYLEVKNHLIPAMK